MSHLTLNEHGYKVFNDAVHGHIELHPLCVKIMDTPQFQRLRDLKQIGGCYFVFPAAAHNRFEHSVGTCYLSSLFVELLRTRQPELNITDVDVLCVSVAAVCHDLGHGPFSHMFDREFIRVLRPDSHWEHEMASVELLDYLIKENNLQPEIAKYGLKEEDLVFIKEIILGCSLDKLNKDESSHLKRVASRECWDFKGRPKEKAFLYEIVANKRNGIDVDKFDYFMRDCHQLNIKCSFDALRLMKFARVINVDEELQICYAEKEAYNIYELFHTRYNLHKRAYQHRVARVIEIMLVDALLLADPYFLLTSPEGKSCRLSQAPEHMDLYWTMTDSIFPRIEFSCDEKLAPARDMLKKIKLRQFYPFVGEYYPRNSEERLGHHAREHIRTELLKLMGKFAAEEEQGLLEIQDTDIVVSCININYGMNNMNPVDFVNFFSKTDPNTAGRKKKRDISAIAPAHFSENFVRIYARRQQVLKVAQKALDVWIQQSGVLSPVNKS